jgi:catechol 2,3-dioxygenase-like lactoylglutathione lyase family enzyme
VELGQRKPENCFDKIIEKAEWGMECDVEPTTPTTRQGVCEASMKLRSLIPVLDVQDVDASIEFYCGALGFTLHDKVEWSGRTEWALLRCGHVHLMLCASDNPDSEDLPSHNSDGMFFLYHDNVESLQVYLGSRGYSDMPDGLPAGWGKRDFYLRDPDGYVLWFSQKPIINLENMEAN